MDTENFWVGLFIEGRSAVPHDDNVIIWLWFGLNFW